jgi:hypothetical protein
MGQPVRIVLVVSIGTALSSCGINALRTAYAGGVSSEGTAVAAASNEFLLSVEASRRLANIELVVADPACGTSPAIVRGTIKMHQEGPGWLCVPPDEPRQALDRQFGLTPVSSQIQPTVLLLSSLSAYTKSLANVVDSKPSDPMEPLLDALETAHSAQGLLLAATGGHDGPIPSADDKRVKAVGDFVGFLAQLSDEAHQVRRLRELLAKSPDGAQPMIDVLQDHLATWENSRKADDGLLIVVNGTVLRRTLDARPPVAPQARREALMNFYQIQDAVGAAADIYPTLSKSLRELAEADKDLRRVIVEHPKLTKAERAKVAELNRQRAIKAMDSVAALITSFKGV